MTEQDKDQRVLRPVTSSSLDPESINICQKSNRVKLKLAGLLHLPGLQIYSIFYNDGGKIQPTITSKNKLKKIAENVSNQLSIPTVMNTLCDIQHEFAY